jgi:hypothetical protein
MPYKYNAITGELDLVNEEFSDNPILQIDTDAGSALPDANGILNILGGTGINTAGATDTVTINLDVPVVVANGGTGKTILTPVNGLVIANSTLAVGSNKCRNKRSSRYCKNSRRTSICNNNLNRLYNRFYARRKHAKYGNRWNSCNILHN